MVRDWFSIVLLNWHNAHFESNSLLITEILADTTLNASTALQEDHTIHEPKQLRVLNLSGGVKKIANKISIAKASQ